MRDESSPEDAAAACAAPQEAGVYEAQAVLVGSASPCSLLPAPAVEELAEARRHLVVATGLLDAGDGRGYAATLAGAMKAQGELRAAMKEFAAWAWAVQRGLEGGNRE